MVKRIFKIALRQLWKQKVYNFINITGLALGIACFIGIVAFAVNEFSYDKHHESYENIFRLKLIGDMSGTLFEAAVTGAPVSKLLYEELPEVSLFTRIIQRKGNVLFEYENKNIYQEKILYADSLFFKMFNFQLEGDPETVLQEPYSLVMMESSAKKYFGNENPLGKTITWNNTREYTITGIIKESVKNSHLTFEVLVSRASLYSSPRYQNIYNSMYAFTNMGYIKCTHSNINILNKKAARVFDVHAGAEMREAGANLVVELQPVKDIHLKSNIIHELDTNGDLKTVYIFIVFAFLILIISSINYINLSIAGSSSRVQEVGIKKMFGSSKRSLFLQFLMESFFITFLAFCFGLLILEIISPLFNSISHKPFDLVLKQNLNWWLLVLLIPVIGMLAGAWPSLFLSSLKIVNTIKGTAFLGKHKSVFRNSMIVVQFVISIFLLSSTWFIYQQLNFIKNKDLGFSKENVMVISLRNGKMLAQYNMLKNEFSRISGVKNCSASSSYPGSFNQRREFYRDGYPSTEMLMIMNLQCEPNFFTFFNIDIKEGRNFYENSDADKNKIIVNEALVNQFGIENPVGKAFRYTASENPENDPKFEIIAVCKDFHYASLHEEVKPLIVWKDSKISRFVYVKLDKQNTEKTMQALSEKWSEYFPEYPFEFFFLDDTYNNLYKPDMNVSRVFTVFTILAILIACLGIFGLTSYTTEKRTKEIGIRKVMGADTLKIMKLISKGYVFIIIISAIISVPVSWYFMNKWLQNFSYKINISWFVFFISSLIAFAIALLFINIKAYLAARKNPVDAIRYE